MTRLGAKSVCGSAAEWGRAERGAASHPPDSLMDHHVDGDGEEEEEDPSILMIIKYTFYTLYVIQ